MRRMFTRGAIPAAVVFLGLLACSNELASSDADHDVSQEVAIDGAGDAGADGTSTDARSGSWMRAPRSWRGAIRA